MRKTGWLECSIFPHHGKNRCVDVLGSSGQKHGRWGQVSSNSGELGRESKYHVMQSFCALVLKHVCNFLNSFHLLSLAQLFMILHKALTVLKYSIPDDMKASATSLVVTTHDMGWPLPMGFPIVTMSGTKSSPWNWKAQKWEPTLPKPTWTSSAIKMPPASRTCL